MRILSSLLLLLACLQASAATYYVSTSGADTNNGTAGAPFRTIAKAATVANPNDVVSVAAGSYMEYVSTGTNNVAWYGTNAITRSFRALHASNTFSGFTLRGSQDSYGTHFYVGVSGHYTTISDNIIGPSTYVVRNNFLFNETSNTVYAVGVNWSNAGFIPGGLVYFGGCSLSNYWFANHDTAWKVKQIDGATMWVTNDAADSFLVETNLSAWSPVFSGVDFGGVNAVRFGFAGGVSATNCTVANNSFTNIMHYPLDVYGYNHRFLSNRFDYCRVGAVIYGAGHEFAWNTWLNSTNWIQWSTYETTVLPHPEGGGTWNDYVGGFFHIRGTYLAGTNIYIHHNWLERLDQPLWQITNDDEHWGLHISNNVFIAGMRIGSGDRNNLTMHSNLFYRCAYDESETAVFTFANATNVSIKGNLFVDCGNHSNTNLEGYYTLSSLVNITTNYNFVCGPETLWFQGHAGFTEPNGINGGNPRFRDIKNPRGPDGLAFTADDGIALLSTSPGVGRGGLLTAPVATNVPIAQFQIASPITGWQDETGTDYDPVWVATAPFDRTNRVRPWDTGEALGTVPLLVTFTATNSISGSMQTNGWPGIFDYVWSFGDGSRPIWTRWPDVSHTYLVPGSYTVTLWVTNSMGATDSMSQVYRILPAAVSFTNTIYYVATNGLDANAGTYASPLRTISNAVNKAVAGDYIAVLPGDYGEAWRSSTAGAESGTAAKRITLVGYGASLSSVTWGFDYWTIEGLEFKGDPIVSGFYSIFTKGYAVDGLVLRNNWFNQGTSNIVAIYMESSSSNPMGTNTTIVNNLFDGIDGSSYGACMKVIEQTNVLIDANIAKDTVGQGDFIQMSGWDVRITRNYCYNIGGSGHPDFVQIVSTPSQPIGDVIIERNWAEMPENTEWQTQISQQVTSTNASLSHSNVVWRNNVFINFPNGQGTHVDGAKVYNNLYYRCASWGNDVVLSGGANGSCYGMEIKNNAFVQCATNLGSTTVGWYQNGLAPWGANVTLAADYNFVCGGTNYAAKIAAPPDQTTRWAVTGQEMHGVNGGDPLFVSAANHDFRLQTNSPLAGAGVPLTSVPVDFWGQARPGIPSIGPFEATAGVFQQPLSPPTLLRIQGKVIYRGNIIF